MPAFARSTTPFLPPSNITTRRDWLAPEPEHIPVNLVTRIAPDAPTLRLSSFTRGELDRFAPESQDGRETGGYIYGHRDTIEGPRVRVSEVTRAVAERAQIATRLDVEASVSRKLALRRDEPHLCEVGCWHTHPDTYNGTPSEADLQMFARSLEWATGTRYFGVIVTPGRSSGWLAPDLHGWMVTRRSPGSAAVCRRVKVG